MVGRESAGVPEAVHAAADARLAIPMRDGTRSINVAMAAAMATVTCNIADMLGFNDRGEIAPGKRADLVRVRRLPEGTGAVRTAWREGVQVA